MTYTPRTTEEVFRMNLGGYMDDIQGYANPANDGHLAAWMTLRSRIEAMLDDANTTIKAISARPMHNPGAQALRAIAALPESDVSSPEEEEVFTEYEAEARRVAEVRAQAAWDSLDSDQKAALVRKLTEEARQIENAHVDPHFAPLLNLGRMVS